MPRGYQQDLLLQCQNSFHAQKIFFISPLVTETLQSQTATASFQTVRTGVQLLCLESQHSPGHLMSARGGSPPSPPSSAWSPWSLESPGRVLCHPGPIVLSGAPCSCCEMHFGLLSSVHCLAPLSSLTRPACLHCDQPAVTAVSYNNS